MRVIVDARALGPHFPGITRATLGLLSGLRALDHAEQFLVLHEASGRARLAQTGVDADHRFELRAVEVGPFSLAQQWTLPHIARTYRADVWHAPYYFRPFLGLPPTVVTVFDTIGPGEERATMRSWGRAILWRVAMRMSIATAKRVITSSEAARRDLRARYRRADTAIRVIPLAADARFSSRPVDEIRRARQKYDVPDLYALYLGSNKPHKNLVTLVDAWSRTLAEGGVGDACLVLAGHEDPRFPAARRRVAELGLERRARFLPDVADDDVPALLSGARCFVFPSLREGFGLPPIEAMACGTPVIVSNRDSLPEVVGDAGLLVEPEADVLAAAITRVLGDAALREELRARGLRRAAQFSWERAARETLEVYREAAR